MNTLTLTPEETANPLALLLKLVAALRPKDPENIAFSAGRLAALTARLRDDAELRAQIRGAIETLFANCKAGALYRNLGILPSTGIFSETRRRIVQKLLPDLREPERFLGDALLEIFFRDTDEIWVRGIEDALWVDFLAALAFEETRTPEKPPVGLPSLLNSLWILSYRMATLGFDAELLRVDPALSQNESPFLAQNLETQVFMKSCLEHWNDPDAVAEDEKQLLVLFDQCRVAVERLHRRAAQAGTSLQLTYKLQCLRDHIRRGEQLATVAGELHRDHSGCAAWPTIIALFKTLVLASCRRNDVRELWRQNLELTARRVTEYAGKAGEHYITETRAEYFGLARAAIGAGGFIALMALIKQAFLHHAHLAPLNEMLAYGLNYGIGFVIIYMLGFTVATKQPAMTANAIAASVGEVKGKARDLEALITLIARTTRSQLVAILGNVSIAIPVAIALSMLFYVTTGAQAISREEADQLIAAHHPFLSGTLFYAAVAGFCLFLSGLIAGYFDNMAIYARIPQRIAHLGWARRFLGQARLDRFARYVGENLGALASNFFFGMLLGMAWGIGMLLGLPLDIRHIAFSSAYLGYAAAAWDFVPPLKPFLWATVGVLGIGLMNLGVSFSLTLAVALRARGVTFSQGNQLLHGLIRRFLTHPREFLLPPKKTAVKEDAAEH
ncbi:MAG: site-specific recombinase [Zoogloeaceae bacterium]|jgi:site-specific recombinase|nr:site-specific recombinase [Zoogloeaceae bacterium]